MCRLIMSKMSLHTDKPTPGFVAVEVTRRWVDVDIHQVDLRGKKTPGPLYGLKIASDEMEYCN